LPRLQDPPQDVRPITPHDDEPIWRLHGPWASSWHARARITWEPEVKTGLGRQSWLPSGHGGRGGRLTMRQAPPRPACRSSAVAWPPPCRPSKCQHPS
jgi:hypothetical protein